MKVLVAAAAHAYSFVNQARDLQKGFSDNGVSTQLTLVRQPAELIQAVEEFKPEVVISVSNWINYPLMIDPIKSMAIKVYPWIVCDEEKIHSYINEYNQHGIVVTVSEHCKENLVRSGMQPEIIQVIPEAVDPNLWYKEAEIEINNLVKMLSTPNPNEDEIKFDLEQLRNKKVPILFTTGGDPTKKGVQEVMRALATLDKQIPWVYLVKTWPTTDIFLKGIEELKLAQELGIWARVRYLVGQFSQDFMRDLMNLSDIYVAPSRSEGFGLPLVEAALCEKPVVTADTTATREKVANGETGFVVKAIRGVGTGQADQEDLATHIEKLLTNETLRREMGKKGRQRALELYTPKVIGKKFLEMISSA